MKQPDDEKTGVQPDPVAAKMVSDVAELLERFGDAAFDEHRALPLIELESWRSR